MFRQRRKKTCSQTLLLQRPAFGKAPPHGMRHMAHAGGNGGVIRYANSPITEPATEIAKKIRMIFTTLMFFFIRK